MLFQKVYKSNWEKQREKGFELSLDALSILTAKAKRDLASNVSSSKDGTENYTFFYLMINYTPQVKKRLL